ncbi:hypothetical protein AGR7C_pAt0192 [Agrobacterium deltaense Zutra 3/1]|uniref:Uncharacterized protein n=1 Tax=Agrobacterium deltaense Zutra 3/1 TaxID=1183427 RepID=A0A1S7S4D6_9HYPH|nr:hypothetical protein AGR7B_pAt0171 [Agrobacterium deltaense RV3]CUX62249.1 hypothetical protein AGR7C_pAt0192 [Agrobacterium deltaense Zutra 3/1]
MLAMRQINVDNLSFHVEQRKEEAGAVRMTRKWKVIEFHRWLP